jgi:molecular chaperone HtpG
LRKLAAFFFWTSWTAATNRPDDHISYTHNWPYEPLVGNRPTGEAVVWTGVSIIMLLAGISAMVWWYASRKEEGMLDPSEKRDRVLDLVLCTSTEDPSKLVSLADFVDAMPAERDTIYFLTGASLDTASDSPHLEAFEKAGVPVLLFCDRVDEVWLEQMPPEYKGKKWQSVGRGEIDLGASGDEESADAEAKAESFTDLLARLRVALQDQVKEVRLSQRLTTSPACLVIEVGEIAPHLAEILRQAGQEVPVTRPILEVNPTHPLLAKLRDVVEADASDARIDEFAALLYSQAQLAEGGRLEDPAAFSRRLTDLMVRAL